MRWGGDAERGEPRCSRKRGQAAAETLAGVGEDTERWGAMPGKVNEEKKEDKGKKKNMCKRWSPKEGICRSGPPMAQTFQLAQRRRAAP